MRDAIAKAEAVLGGVGILANNAGVGASGAGELENIGAADLDRMFGVHVTGAFAVAQAVVRSAMIEEHGMDAIVEEASWNLMNRWAEPEEIAATVAFLVSGVGSYYTGQLMCPNGGDPVAGI